jgi:transcription elongation factor GreB
MKHYVTPTGFSQLQKELEYLISKERPKIVAVVSWAAGNGDRSENGDYIYGKKRLREIDRRARYLTKKIQTAVIVPPSQQQGSQQVFFGAKVDYLGADGSEKTVQIVGVDEAEMSQGKISYTSPVAKALIKSQRGDVVSVSTPDGIEELEVVSITYPL